MDLEQLSQTANALVARRKGILAADESPSTIERRLRAVGVPSTVDTRRAWRELLLTTPGIEDYISGVILHDETIRQSTSGGVPFVDVLKGRGIIPGIKVDKGTTPLPLAPGEAVTEGLDGLRQRLQEYRDLGARFAKWRAVITIGPDIPSTYCIRSNAQAMARYAALCQEEGLVPIVEPEVLMDGGHDIQQCFDVTSKTLFCMFSELRQQRVAFEGMLLKPNMVVSGQDAADRAGPETVAAKTLECFLRTVPAAVPGIVFLSGGQGDDEAIENLNAINQKAHGAPWQLSFSYGRGLQAAPLKVWSGQPENVERGQQAFLLRARLTSVAREGQYHPQLV